MALLLSGGRPDSSTLSEPVFYICEKALTALSPSLIFESSNIFLFLMPLTIYRSSTLAAEKVSDMLDRLYLAFDALADRYGVYKIDTIGDGG